MDIPEKIYLVSGENEAFVFTQKRSDNLGVEYTRTDAFIKKACAYLDSIGHRYIIDAFRKYMKE